MVDIANEALLTLAEAAARFPGRNGKRCSIQTVYRWCYRGVHRPTGTVRLESVVIGGRRYTSQEAIKRFVERLNPCGEDVNPQPLPRSLDTRLRESDKAQQELRHRQRTVKSMCGSRGHV
jgi:hypothetical protein